MATVSRMCCFRKVCHEGEGGLRNFGRYYSTVDLATTIPSFLSSPTAQSLIGPPHTPYEASQLPCDRCALGAVTQR